MRFDTEQHPPYCGVDLHARNMYACILDSGGNKRLHRNIPANPDEFLDAIRPFPDGAVVGAECMFTWYCLPDLSHDCPTSRSYSAMPST